MNKKVKDNPEIFSHGSEIYVALKDTIPDYIAAIETSFFDLSQILFDHYYDYLLVYDDISRWQDRVTIALMNKKNWLNEMLKTTQYVYNPIHNVDETLTETTAKKDDVTDTVDSSSHSDSGSYDFPMDTTKSKQTAHTEGSATGTSARVSSGESNQTRTLNRAGNIGVTSTQELIRQQRAIQVVLVNFLYTILDDFLFLDVDRLEE